MKLSFFKYFFKVKTDIGTLKNSKTFQVLKKTSQKYNLLMYSEKTIYHHSKSFFVPLLVLDPMRGIYIFEYKTWSYDTLKNATAKSSKEQQSDDNILAFDNIKNILKTKLKELTHIEGIDTFNFVLMENLTSNEYDRLDISLQKLLPKDRVIFNDSTQEDIINKLRDVTNKNKKSLNIVNTIGNLFIQYLILSDDSKYMATKEQMEFIDADIKKYQVLYGANGSGRTSSILLKTVLYKLQYPKHKVLIISPTLLSCDILKKRLLNIVEHAVIELDLTSIDIFTPIELLNKHLTKYKKPILDNDIYVPYILMKKKFRIANLIICDDSDLLPNDFILYLKHIQNKNSLLLVTNKLSSDTSFIFTAKIFQNLNINFIQANPHAKALQLIARLLKKYKAKDIIVVSNETSKKKLDEDLEFFIKDKSTLLDSSKNLIDQNLDNILLVTHLKTSAINAKFVIIMDICEASMESLEHSIGLAQNGIYFLYEDDCQQIRTLQDSQLLR